MRRQPPQGGRAEHRADRRGRRSRAGGPLTTTPLPRRPGRVRFASYNTLDLFADPAAAGQEHYRLVTEVIRALDPDVLAVQEIVAPGEAEARRRLCQLAADTGLRCLAPGRTGEPVPALGLGARGYHLGLLWRDGIEPVPGSYRTVNAGLWHALAWVTLDVGGVRVRHAVFHATPFGTRIRASHNEIVVASLARPGSRVPALAGADWNGESADRVRDPRTGAWVPYEPRDPYQGVEWFEDLVHQCAWEYGPEGQRRHWADRSAGEVLWAGGLHDAAAVTGAPWQATAGHHPADPYGARGIRRRIDAVKVTPEVVPALREHWVTSTELTRMASDHLPVTVEYEPAAITPARAEASSQRQDERETAS